MPGPSEIRSVLEQRLAERWTKQQMSTLAARLSLDHRQHRGFVANSVERAVVSGTKWHGPFVTDLAAHGPRLPVTIMIDDRRENALRFPLTGVQLKFSAISNYPSISIQLLRR